MYLPYTVKYVSVWKDSYVQVGLNDVVELSVLLVPEEGVRHPDLPRVGHRQVFDAALKKKQDKKSHCCPEASF
jgi:hypothetical protein